MLALQEVRPVPGALQAEREVQVERRPARVVPEERAELRPERAVRWARKPVLREVLRAEREKLLPPEQRPLVFR